MSTPANQNVLWAQLHAEKIEKCYEKWQKPLGIDGQPYLEFLISELQCRCKNPLEKELIEKIV